MPCNIDPTTLQAVVFDFDGVLTDDRVWVDQNGLESVVCSRRDGLAFDVLRRTHLKLFILSTEANPVVARRAEKLKVGVLQGSGDKAADLATLARREQFDLARTLYVGNDVNDLEAVRLCGFSACPSDAHPLVLSCVSFCLAARGGRGVAREIVEGLFQIDIAAALSSAARPDIPFFNKNNP